MTEEHVEEPSSNWSLLHSMFYSLSFLSQHVEASSCPKCMGSDHDKLECALEPQPEPTRSRPSSRQLGPAKKRFRRDVTPQSGATTKAICFSFNALDTRNPVIGSTNAFGVVVITRWLSARQQWCRARDSCQPYDAVRSVSLN